MLTAKFSPTKPCSKPTEIQTPKLRNLLSSLYAKTFGGVTEFGELQEVGDEGYSCVSPPPPGFSHLRTSLHKNKPIKVTGPQLLQIRHPVNLGRNVENPERNRYTLFGVSRSEEICTSNPCRNLRPFSGLSYRSC
jgi:hypothetical protein